MKLKIQITVFIVKYLIILPNQTGLVDREALVAVDRVEAVVR